MKQLRPLAILLTLALAATPALAQNSTQSITLEHPYYNGPAVIAHSVYVGPYTASTPGMPSFPVYCVDFLHGVHVGDTWTANFTSVQSLIGDASNLGRTRWGQVFGGAAIGKYETAAWLATQFATNSTSSWGGIHAAMWNVFTPGVPSWSESASWSTAAAGADLSSFNWDYWYVVTDTRTTGGEYGKQEYLTYITPEPATLLLLGTGLAGLVGITMIRRRVV